MEAKNRFFVIDGIDGAGKTTQIKLLTGIMHSYGITYQLI